MLTKLREAKLEKFFCKIYSVGSNFNSLLKDKELYESILDELRIKPQQLVHIGSNFDLDYKVPSALGVNCFLISRSGRRKEPFTVIDLYEFEQQLKELEC